MGLLYLGGALVNPSFFGSMDAFHALLRDAARYAVMAVGMTFVIVNKDLDLSVGFYPGRGAAGPKNPPSDPSLPAGRSLLPL
jgi:ribose/xylose/arabinose/galactoside ABC-type transport system permease subunit